MKDSWVTVGEFSTVGEAELARNRLEEEGIPAQLGGAEAVAMLWAFSGAGGVQLLVAEEDAGRAEAILQRAKQRGGRGRRDDYGLEENITADPEKVSVPADEAPAEPDEDDDEAAVETPKDGLARRAAMAAVVGLVTCPGVLHIFSVFMLLDIRDAKGELTPVGRRRAVVALVLDVLVFLGIVLGAFAFMRV
jgi:hypothetical protein